MTMLFDALISLCKFQFFVLLRKTDMHLILYLISHISHIFI